MSRATAKERIASELESVRRRSLSLLDPVTEDDLLRQHSPLMSPLVWDLAHIGNYEEQWLLGAIADTRIAAHLDDIYDAFRNPRRDRPQLDLLAPLEARAYVADVRGRVLDVLEDVELDDRPLLGEGFVYGMVVQHEHQHDETMTATLQLRSTVEYPLALPSSDAPDGDRASLPAEVRVDGGAFVMGTDLEPWAYDNERPAHTVQVDAFWIDTTPVTNRAYAEFVSDGGYADRRWWTDGGWAWVQEASLEHPEFWSSDGAGGWVRTRLGRAETVPDDEPVQHVCWYE
ncbi:MAG: DinB family protein, partial [Acidimicrobiia bacterium]|nr:DinB family protein [Acidimicrobiia bacterium]